MIWTGETIKKNGSIDSGKRLSPLIFITVLVIFLIGWLLIVRFSYPVFQNTREVQPFAEISSLFPLFFILLVFYCIFVCSSFLILCDCANTATTQLKAVFTSQPESVILSLFFGGSEWWLFMSV